jgi:hypothetical protein
MGRPMNKRLDEIAEFDEDRARDAAGKDVAEMRDINGEAFDAFRRGARWQFDQNKAALEAMRASLNGWGKDAQDTRLVLASHEGTIANLKSENANLRAALERAKEAFINSFRGSTTDVEDLIAEIEKLERGGV